MYIIDISPFLQRLCPFDSAEIVTFFILHCTLIRVQSDSARSIDNTTSLVRVAVLLPPRVNWFYLSLQLKQQQNATTWHGWIVNLVIRIHPFDMLINVQCLQVARHKRFLVVGIDRSNHWFDEYVYAHSSGQCSFQTKLRDSFISLLSSLCTRNLPIYTIIIYPTEVSAVECVYKQIESYTHTICM